MDDFKNIDDIKAEEKRLYEEYKAKVAELKKIQKEKEAVGQVFTKGLLPIYVLFILHLGPSNGNDISNKISKRTSNLWTPSTGGIYPLLKKLEKDFKTYKIQKAEEEKQQQTQELAKLLMESGLTLDEIKEKLVKNTKKRTDKTENDKSVEKTEEQKETA